MILIYKMGELMMDKFKHVPNKIVFIGSGIKHLNYQEIHHTIGFQYDKSRQFWVETASGALTK